MTENRKRRGREEVRGILAEYRSSGLTRREFAEREGVQFNTLAYWLRRERFEQEGVDEGECETALVAVEEAGPADAVYFAIQLDGLRIEIPRDVSAEEWRRLREAWAS